MNQNKQLKAAANQIKPVVIIGTLGLTESVHTKINECLNSHELIKVRVNTPSQEDRITMIDDIATRHNATLVNRIGHVAVFYRKKEENEAPSK